MKKNISLLIVFVAALQPSQPLFADDFSFQTANLTIVWSEANRAFSVRGTLPDGSSKSIVTRSKPKATCVTADGTDLGYFTSDSFAAITYTTQPISDEFGDGTAHLFTFSAPTDSKLDGIQMQQAFYTYEQQPFVLTRLSLLATPGTPVSSHHLEPVCCEAATWRFLSTAEADNRMLKVPFDNDGFGRYHTYRLNRSMTSYEVSCLFDGTARYGAVYGSVDHDHWKNGICVEATGGTSIKKLQLISGMADSETRDHLSDYGNQQHGSLRGDTIPSARFLLGLFTDWREGMERFADACATVRPARNDWTAGTPFGWQSWGVLAEKNSYAANVEISDYYATVLQPGGFHNSQGNIVFSLDASDNHSSQQKRDFIAHATQNGQMVGSYATPFALWWDEASINSYTVSWTQNGEKVTRPISETLIKINGKPVKYDGAYCRDPTHPVTKQEIVNFVRARAAEGIKWIKADFLNCGIIQSDRYYKEGITTAVEAYNDGMRYLQQQCERYGIFLALSIAPLFPHGHANSRRIACDTWGRIDQTEYAMNAISGGWWTDRLYQYNDPDHLVLVGAGDQMYASLGENRARYLSGVCAGMMLVADNFSPNDKSGRGNNSLSRQRAAQIMLNADINAVADLGRSFRPLYGNREYDLNDAHAQNLFVHQTDSFIYLAAFNYTSSILHLTVPLTDLGLNAVDEVSEIKELWTGEVTPSTSAVLTLNLPAKDARLFRLRRSQPLDGIGQTLAAPASPIVCTEYFDLQGRSIPIDAATAQGHNIFLRRTVYADGTAHTKKVVR